MMTALLPGQAIPSLLSNRQLLVICTGLGKYSAKQTHPIGGEFGFVTAHRGVIRISRTSEVAGLAIVMATLIPYVVAGQKCNRWRDALAVKCAVDGRQCLCVDDDGAHLRAHRADKQEHNDGGIWPNSASQSPCCTNEVVVGPIPSTSNMVHPQTQP